MKTARCAVWKPGSISYARPMLRKNSAAVTSSRNENATCPTSSALADVTLLRLLPVVRASSFSASATLARDALNAGMVPNRKPVASETISAKTNTVASSFGVTKFADPGSRPEQELQPRISR